MSTESAIIVDLNQLENTAPLLKNQLIYREEYDILKNKIIDKIKISKNINQNRKNGLTLSNSLCFFIDGARGSGKSTIMRVLEKDLSSGNEYNDPKIGKLASIDPSEIGETENFFIHILGHVQKMLLTFKRKCILEEKEKGNLKKAYECMQTMSSGLSLLTRNPDSIQHYDDANYLIQKSISECVSSSSLKVKFFELAEALCEMLKVDVLMVTLDDADMNFIKCKDVLETVRKYLLNSRMLFVFAGDLRLFSQVVRGMQLNNFGEKILKYDNSSQSSVFKMIDNLEDQYIMKFFPLDNRMSLRGYQKKLKKEILIKYENDKEKEAINLSDFLQNCEKLSSLNIGNKTIMDFISVFPMRSVLQLLSYWAKRINKNNSYDENAHLMCRGIRYVTHRALQQYEADTEINRGRLDLLKKVILHARSLKRGTDGARLLSGYGDEMMQQVSFYLSAEISRQIRTIPDILAYILCVFPCLHENSEDDTKSDKLYNLLSNNVFLQDGTECTKIMLEVYRRGNRQTKPFANGIVPLMPYHAELPNKSIVRYSCEDYFESLVKIVKKDVNKNSLAHFLAIYHSITICDVNGKPTCCLSIYNLLCVILKVLSLERTETYIEDIKEILFNNQNMSFLRQDEEKTTLKVRSDRHYSQKAATHLSSFINYLYELKEIDSLINEIFKEEIELKKHAVSPMILHDIWKEFLLNCAEITEKANTLAMKVSEIISAGDLYVMYMEAFSNAIKRFWRGKIDESDNVLENCILWKTLAIDKQINKKLFDLLNKVSIAPINLVINWDKYENAMQSKMYQIRERILHWVQLRFDDLRGRSSKKYDKMWEDLQLMFTLRCSEIKSTSQTHENKFFDELNSVKNDFNSIYLHKIAELFEDFQKELNEQINSEIESSMMEFKNNFFLLSREEDAESLIKDSAKQLNFSLRNIWHDRLRLQLESGVSEIEFDIKNEIEEIVERLVQRCNQEGNTKSDEDSQIILCL